MKIESYNSELVYDLYYDIEESNHQEKIRYFDKNIAEIYKLPFNLMLDIRIDYTLALYAVEELDLFLRKADKLIYLVINENIFDYRGRDIFKELLYCKSEALHRQTRLKEARHVAKELIKMDKQNISYQKKYFNIMVDLYRQEAQAIRGLSIILFLASAIVIAFELLLIRPFYNMYTELVELGRSFLFVSGISVLVLHELNIRIKARKSLKEMAQ